MPGATQTWGIQPQPTQREFREKTAAQRPEPTSTTPWLRIYSQTRLCDFHLYKKVRTF